MHRQPLKLLPQIPISETNLNVPATQTVLLAESGESVMESLGQVALEEPRLAEEAKVTSRDDLFAALVRRQARFVFRVSYSVLRNVQDAEDVVQETFLKLYRGRTWERMLDERAFLARSAWRMAVDKLPKGPRGEIEAEPPSDRRNPEQEAMAADLNMNIHRLIDALPEELRLPLALSSVEELTSGEIAVVMGIPEGTVRTRMMRARQILKEKLAVFGMERHG